MNKEGKAALKCDANCKRHKFKIKIQISEKSKKGEIIQLSFCPEVAIEQPIKSVIPIANAYKQPFYPMFIQPHSLQKVTTLGNQYKKQFYNVKQKQQLYLDVLHKTKETIYQPKPRTNYCRVCDYKIGNYIEHIKSLGHVGRLKEDRLFGILDGVYHQLQQTIRQEQQIKTQTDIPDKYLIKLNQASHLMKKFTKMLGLINSTLR